MPKPRFTRTLTALLTLAVLSTGCSGTLNEQVETDAVTDEIETELVIASGGFTDFYVIRGDNASDRETKCAVKVRRTISNKTGAEPGITTDWEDNPVYEHEIIVGRTLRESKGMIDRTSLGETGYVIREIDGKVYIAGGSEKGTELAVEYFLENYIVGNECKIKKGESVTVYHQYDIPSFYIDMEKLDSDCVISIPKNDYKKLAEKLRDKVYDKCGVRLEITTDSGRGFIISEDTPSDKGMHEITVEDRSIVFKSSASTGVSDCVEMFIDKYLSDVYGDYNFPSDFRYYDLGDYIVVSFPNDTDGGAK